MKQLSKIELHRQLEEAKKEVKYYKKIAEETGNFYLREAEALSKLIFQHRQTEKVLRNSEARLNALSDASFESIFLSEKGICIDQNQTAVRMFGYTHDEAVGRNGMEWIAPEDRQQVKNNMLSGYEKPYEVTALHKDGTTFPCEIQARMIDYHGRSIRVTALRDITERKRAEDALKRQTKTLNDILEKAADGICVCHNISKKPYVRFTHWNPRMTEITGYTIEEINRSGWYQSMYPDPELQQKAIERMAAMRKSDDIQAEEWMITTKSGRKKSLSISTSVVKEEDGAVHVLALMQDITERKKAEEELSASEKKYRFLAENMVDIVWTIDQSFRTTYVSPSIEKVLGFTADERKQQALEEMITPESLQNIQMKFMEELQREENGTSDPDRYVTMEVEYYRKDLSTVWMENTMNAIRDTDGVIVGIHGVSRDITERKKAEEALQQAHDELEQRVKERTRALEIQKRSLEDVNTALNVMLKKRDEDRLEIEEKVMLNVKELIEPLIENLKTSGLDDSQTGYVDTLETFLAEIVSPFSQTLHTKYLNLTLSEIRVANLIKEGKTTKEIARLLNSTPRAIEFHRQNLRKKLGISNRKVNLASHLLHLPK